MFLYSLPLLVFLCRKLSSFHLSLQRFMSPNIIKLLYLFEHASICWQNNPIFLTCSSSDFRPFRSFHKLVCALNPTFMPQNSFLCKCIRWPLFSYLHHNSQSLIIIILHWTQLLESWSHDTNYMLWTIKVFWVFLAL